MSTLEEMTTSTVRWERLSYGLVLLAVAGVALVSNTERRLFGGMPGERAFAAVSPLGDRAPENGFTGVAYTGNPLIAPGGVFGRRRTGVVGGAVPNRAVAATGSNGIAPGAAGDGTGGAGAPAADGAGLASVDASDVAPGRGGGGASFAPDVGGLPAIGGLVTGGGTSASPTPTPTATPTPTPTTTATPIPSAVPEAATWMMLIGGFALVGAAMRRRRSGATGIISRPRFGN